MAKPPPRRQPPGAARKPAAAPRPGLPVPSGAGAAAARPGASRMGPGGINGGGLGPPALGPSGLGPPGLGPSGLGRSKAPLPGLLLVLVLLVPAALMFLPSALLLAIGMLPTMVAVIIDRDPDKYAPITVGPLNFCGVLPFLIELWRGRHTLDHAASLMGDPLTLMIMYVAAGFGWLLYYAVPPVIAAITTARNDAEIKRMQEHQAKLIEEWGEAVAELPGTDQRGMAGEPAQGGMPER